ncbi:MAG TPA: DEAD/DEAH box helicase [Vicinamibacterales bacterium]|nr:DEAD/DEAH box helicase [Vicinamibacterales bacterium]
MAPKDPETPGFASLGLTPSLVLAVTALGYEEPTPIQREAIPFLLAGRDVLGQAGTGTGKTAAFVLPLLQRLAKEGGKKGTTRGFILVPTRELAMQVAEATHKYAKGQNLAIVPVYGGAPMDLQIRSLRRGADIVVATPGRAIDHLKRGTLSLASVQVLVLDEGDEMLDMGFADDLEAILEQTPEGKQTALFAATFPKRLQGIAAKHLDNPARVTIAAEKQAVGKLPKVRQTAYIVARPQKMQALDRILEFEDPQSAIVFCRTRLEVEEVTETLQAHGYGAQAIHGGMLQKQRDRVMGLFRSQKADILVATDVAARGLDIEHVSHVFNFDVPLSPEVYVHRIGRTGRAGREGVAITIVDPRQSRLMRNIESLTRQKVDIAALPTTADLRARRVTATVDGLRATIAKGEFKELRGVVETLAQEFDVVDIAAAALAMIDDSGRSGAPAPAEAAPARFERPGSSDARAERPRPQRPERFGILHIGAGANAGIRPGDLVGAISGETGLESSLLGRIKIDDEESYVEVPESKMRDIVAALRATKIRGQKVPVAPFDAGAPRKDARR